uniref:Reverse transcriptase domain-containing protein n=1 Tax=Physcomitrium patens TaxID=3218 RepID=A0A2K1ICF6_PHYPA|nr:hypothetical protein PHYPA_030440 [Physcomitrium patens]
MDQILFGLSFTRCYIDDVIIFNNIPQDHNYKQQHAFDTLKQKLDLILVISCQNVNRYFQLHID